MTKAILFYRKSLLTKLFMLVMLLVGGGNFAWGAETYLTINDGGTQSTNAHFPFYGGYANKSPLVGQYIIPKGDITSIKGNTITKIKLYFSSSSISWGTATFKVYLKEIDNETFASTPTIVSDGLTEVYSGSLAVIDKEMVVTFDKSYNYGGNNLLVSFNLTSTGTTGTVNCYCKSNTSVSGSFSNIAYQYSGYQDNIYTYGEKYLPKMTLYYETGGAPTDFTASSPSYNSTLLSWTAGGDEANWQVKYNSGEDFDPATEGTMASDDPVTTNSYTLTGLSENTTYYAYVRAYIDAVNQSDWVGPVSFTTLEQYPTPIDFALNGFTATTATFGWSNGEGTEATAWQIKYSTTKGFNPDETGTLVAANANPFTIEKLTESTTYYARLRADYGSSHYSSWNATEVEFTPSNDVNTLVNNGTDKSYYVPIAGSSVSSNENTMVKSQFIIPASSITAVRNRQITKLTFYAENSSVSWGTATFEVYLREVDYTTFSSTSFESWGTKVFNSASLSVSGNEMSIALNTPFNYKDGNLQIGIKQTGTGSSSSTTWLSVKDGGYAYLAIYGTGTGNTGTRTYYAPKVTITSVPTNTAPVQIGENGYTTFASRYSLDLTNVNLPSGLKAYKAAIDAENSKVRFTEINQTIPENTGVLLEGTAGQTYAIPVANSGTALDGNDFLVNSTGGTFTADDGYTYFGMKKATSASDALVFATFAPGSVAIPTDKAYLKVLTSSLPATSRQLVCSFGDETPTGISATQNDREKTINDEFIYNLNGQRVNMPSKGLYIVNGKKVIIK